MIHKPSPVARVLIAAAELVVLAFLALYASSERLSRGAPNSATLLGMTAVSGPAVVSGAPSAGLTAPRRARTLSGALALAAALLAPLAPVTATASVSSTAEATGTATVDPTLAPPTSTNTVTPTLGVTPVISATTTATVPAPPTPTLGSEWGLDALCRCHVPPLEPGSPECQELQRRHVATLVSQIASVTAFARGTDTPTAPPTPSPTPSTTPSLTPWPTEEPTPTPAPTWTARVVVVTATPLPSPTLTPRRQLWLPFAYLRRPRR